MSFVSDWSTKTTYTERRIAEARRLFYLDKPGIWWIVPEARGDSLVADLVTPPIPNECSPALCG